jgi:hypothetical protein
MLEIPEELKVLVKPITKLIEEAASQVERCRKGQRVEYERFESELGDRVAALELAAHEACLSALDVDAPRIRIGGRVHVRVGRHEAAFKTRAGEVSFPRSVYRCAGERNARVVNTVSLRARTVEDEWLPGVARQMAHLLQQGTSREAEVTAHRLGVLPYSRSSFERIGHAVGELYVRRNQDIEEALIQAETIPEGTRSVSLSLDRVSVPMEEPRPRPVGRPRKEAPARPVARVYRMAYCGTVTLHDREGNALRTIRYGTMPDGDPEALAMGMAGDVLALRSKQRNLSVSLLCDGAPEMWNLLNAEVTGPGFGAVTRLIDFWHVIEKLAPAAQVMYGEHGAGALRRWKLALLHRDCAASNILDELRASGKENVRRHGGQPVHDAVTYFANNAEKMNYADARRRGLPIGSGNVEATCKTLIALRMKRCGARWKTRTGEEIIHLRALSLSDRWDRAMDLTLRRPQVKIRVAA